MEAVEFDKANNLSRQEVIDTENELAKAVQAKNSRGQVQKVGLKAEAHITSQTTRPVEPMFNAMMNVGDTRVDVFKSSHLLSQDCAEVNLYGIAARYIVTVVSKNIWELHCNSHTVTIQWVHMVVDPLLPI